MLCRAGKETDTPSGACPARRAGPLRLCGAGRFGGALPARLTRPGGCVLPGGGALGLRCSRPLRSAPCALCAAFSWWPVGRLSALAAAVPRAPCRRRASPSPSGVVARAGVIVVFPAALRPGGSLPAHFESLPRAPGGSLPAHFESLPRAPFGRAAPSRFPGGGFALRGRLRRTLARDGLASACRRALAGWLRWKFPAAVPPWQPSADTRFLENLTPLTGFFSPRTSPKTGQKTRQKSRPRAAFFLS